MPIYNILFFSGVIIFIVLLLLIMYLSYRIYGSFMEKKYDKVIMLIFVGLLIFICILKTGQYKESKYIDTINYNEYSNQYKLKVINIVGKHSGYNKYMIVDTFNGRVVNLSESNYMKLNCTNFNINVFEGSIIFKYIFYEYKISDEFTGEVLCLN